MSKLSEDARASAKSKAERLVRSDPHARVDASGYSPEGAEDGDVQTGPRPISRRQFRRGGKVAGDASPSRADRKPRATGGALTPDTLINRNVKSANEDRVGTKHDGGMKKGGRVHKTMGGMALPAWNTPVARKEGGAVHAEGCKCAKCSGGRVERKDGGKLSTDARDHIKTKNFAGPDRSYPIENASHARNALARVAQHGSSSEKAEVRAKVHAKYPSIGKAAGGALDGGTRPVGGRMARKSGGRAAKKGTNVNIIIAPAQSPQGAPPMPMRPPVAPPGGPLGLRQGLPPPAPAGMPPPGAGAPAPMMRKSGGRVPRGYPIDAGAGSGLGRLEKAERAARG